MGARPDVPLIIALAGYVLGMIVLFTEGVNSSLLVVGPLWIVQFGYAAYLAFRIRSALRVGLYRNQALGVVIFGTVVVVAVFFLFSSFLSLGYLGFAAQSFAFIALYYWIDTIGLAGRRSDPLLRDPLHLRKARFLFWAVILGGVILNFSYAAYSVLLLGHFPGGNTTFTTFPEVLIIAFILAAFFAPPLAGAILLPVVYRRSRDMFLRRHLRWLAVLSIWLFSFLVVATGPIGGRLGNEVSNAFFPDAGYVGVGYFLYRSARSLVPLNRLSPKAKRNSSAKPLPSTDRRQQLPRPTSLVTGLSWNPAQGDQCVRASIQAISHQ
jgi:hypothetical protein